MKNFRIVAISIVGFLSIMSVGIVCEPFVVANSPSNFVETFAIIGIVYPILASTLYFVELIREQHEGEEDAKSH